MLLHLQTLSDNSDKFLNHRQDPELSLPSQFADILTNYDAMYQKLKTPRHLIWQPWLGTMDVEVEIKVD